MEPGEYKAKELGQLVRILNARQIRNAIKGAFRAEARRVRKVAVDKMNAAGITVKGNASDMEKAIRPYVYSKGGGFMITVKPKKKGDASMHMNRHGKLKPVMMWLNDGTVERQTRGAWSKRRNTGRVHGLHFLDEGAPVMYQMVEADIGTEIERAVEKQIKKAGL